MTKPIWIWLRPEEGPCVLQRGTSPRGEGPVYEVQATSRTEAEGLVATFRQDPADPDKAPEKWIKQRQAKKRVRLLSLEDLSNG